MYKENNLEKLLYEVLMVTDGRTTDILEVIVGEKVSLKVFKQKNIRSVNGYDENILRESLLISENSNRVISQNISIINPSAIPIELYNDICRKDTGIGSTIKEKNILSKRKILNFGWRKADEISDIFNNPYFLKFEINAILPFKEYKIYFDSSNNCGIHILEYFNVRQINLNYQNDMIGETYA
jgi:chorismate-pyruvate lyase